MDALNNSIISSIYKGKRTSIDINIKTTVAMPVPDIIFNTPVAVAIRPNFFFNFNKLIPKKMGIIPPIINNIIEETNENDFEAEKFNIRKIIINTERNIEYIMRL